MVTYWVGAELQIRDGPSANNEQLLYPKGRQNSPANVEQMIYPLTLLNPLHF